MTISERGLGVNHNVHNTLVEWIYILMIGTGAVAAGFDTYEQIENLVGNEKMGFYIFKTTAWNTLSLGSGLPTIDTGTFFCLIHRDETGLYQTVRTVSS